MQIRRQNLPGHHYRVMVITIRWSRKKIDRCPAIKPQISRKASFPRNGLPSQGGRFREGGRQDLMMAVDTGHKLTPAVW